MKLFLIIATLLPTLTFGHDTTLDQKWDRSKGALPALSQQKPQQVSQHSSQQNSQIASPQSNDLEPNQQDLRYGHCRILMPNRVDANDRYCNNSFGITYYGHKTNRYCYSTLDRAMSVMHNTNACRVSKNYDHCEILFPNRTDSNDRYCDNTFGVIYFGHKTNTYCYSDIDEAFRQMYATQSCSRSPRFNDCSLLMPNRVDHDRRYCDRSFGVTYRGYKIDTYCYNTLDSAYAKMLSAASCQ